MEAAEEVEEVTVKEALSGTIDIEIPIEEIKKEIEVGTKMIEKGVVDMMIGEKETEGEIGNEIVNMIEKEIMIRIMTGIESIDMAETGIVGTLQ